MTRGAAGGGIIARAYGEGASAYASVLDPFLAPLVERMVRAAEVTEGSRVIDLATGTGVIARAASVEGASVVGVDFSAGMLALARRLSRPAIRYVAGDASALPLRRGVADAVTCGLALSHIDDIAGALAEARRVLRPRGLLVASSWGAPVRNPPASAVLDTLRRHAGEAVHPFASRLDEGTWSSREAGSAALRRAGFGPVQVDSIRMEGAYDRPEDAFDWVFAWPSYGMTLRGLAPAARAAVETESVEALRRQGRLEWDLRFNVFIARRPDAGGREGPRA